MKHMILVNLHETEFIEDVLKILAECRVRDSVVYTVDGVASHHGYGGDLEESVLGSITRLFSQERNINNLVFAITEEEVIDEITERLKKLRKEDRWAASFWFLPIKGYFYHKHEE